MPWQEADLPRFLVLVFSMLKEERKWKWSTMVTKMASVQGALALLPLYSRNLPPILLKHSPEWVQAMKGAGKKATQEIAKQAKPATWANIQEAMRKEKSEKVKYAMLIAWLTCARVGCVLQLRREDVRETEQGLAVQFRRGKSVLVRKTAYTVHTAKIPEEYRLPFQAFLCKQKGFIFFHVKGHQVKTSLRRADTMLEQRSIRRGALQTLAKVGKMSLESMLAFSGHTNVKMLQRYLDFGMQEPPEMTSASAAAAARMVLPISSSPL
jgi:integrase